MINQDLKSKYAFKMRAQIYNTLMNSSSRSSLALKFSLFILTIFQTSLIFSDLQSVNYENWITELTSKPISQVGNGILKVGSTINSIISGLGIYNISRLLTPNTLILIILILTVLVCLNILTIWNADLVSLVALQKPTKRGRVFLRPIFKVLMQLTFQYYDLIFPICLILSSGTISCRWIEIDASTGANKSVLSRTIFASTFIAAQVFNVKDETLPVHVNFLHDEVRCLSNNDLILKFLGVFLFISSLCLRVVFSKLRRFSRNPLCYDSSLDSSALIQEVLINFFLATTHILQVVLPSNRTQEQKDEIMAEYYSDDRRVLLEGEDRSHIFSGIFLKQNYTICIYLAIFA